MAWITLTNGELADANDINNNFDMLSAGDMLPRSSIGVNFDVTNSAYDLGSSSYRWNNIYVNNAVNINSVSSLSNTIWILEAEVTLSVTTSLVEFTGLNGDTDTSYYVFVNDISPTNTAANLFMHINGVSATSEHEAFAMGVALGATSTIGMLNNNVRGIPVGAAGSINSAAGVRSHSFSRTIIDSKAVSGKYRHFHSDQFKSPTIVDISFLGITFISQKLTYSAIEITALQFEVDNVGNPGNMDVGTNIQIWRRG